MASEPLLDFDTLLAPIPGDEPAGTSLPYDVKEKLEEYRKEENPDEYAPDDPMRPEQAKKADWPAIIRLAKETLQSQSKDLLLAARLTEALLKQNGFAGLRDGLHLMGQMVDQAWDRIYPSIEDGDLEVRAGPFNWLDDPDRGARFPNAVRQAPLLRGDGRTFGWLDWRMSQDGRGQVTREDFDKAIVKGSREQSQNTLDDIEQSLKEMSDAVQVMNGKLGRDAPGLTSLRSATDECRRLLQQIIQRQAPAGGVADAGTQADGQQGGGGASGVSGSVSSREDAYRQLSQIAALLQRLEPHSPIPYLVQRTIELGAMPFPQLIKALIRDNNVLTELNREMGIKDDGSAPPPAE